MLYTLRAMGHGDKLILCDSNFPAYSMNSRVHRIDGVDAAKAAKAIFSIFPLDSFIKYPVVRMQIDDNPDELNDVHVMKYQNTVGLLIEAIKDLKAEIEELKKAK